MKTININRLNISIFLSTFIFLALFNAVSAYTITQVNVDDSQDFVVEPGKSEIFLNSGQTVTRNISVTNRTNRRMDFTVSVENMKGSETADAAVVLIPAEEQTPFPLHQYVSLEVEEFSLEFGQKITFAVSVSAPPGLEPGGHYGAIVISTEAPRQIDEAGNEVVGGARLTSRIGSLILMRVNGEVNESGYLSDFKVSGPKRWFYQNMPNSFEISYKNEGSVHLVPYGEILVRNMFGAEIAQIPVDAYFVLPGSLRNQPIVWSGKPFSFGYYSAELNLYKGYGNQFENQKIRFFVIPLVILLPVVGVFLFIFLLVYFITRRYEFKRK